jgi:hypothetical protein
MALFETAAIGAGSWGNSRPVTDADAYRFKTLDADYELLCGNAFPQEFQPSWDSLEPMANHLLRRRGSVGVRSERCREEIDIDGRADVVVLEAAAPNAANPDALGSSEPHQSRGKLRKDG